MKKLCLALIASLALFASCDIGPDGLDGNAYVKIKTYGDIEFSELDGLVPVHFSDTVYYRAYPGTYHLEYGYRDTRHNRPVYEWFTTDIEIWIETGEAGRTKGRKGEDAKHDMFFDIYFFADGNVEVEHERVRIEHPADNGSRKSFDMNAEAGGEVVKTGEGKGFTYTVRHMATVEIDE